MPDFWGWVRVEMQARGLTATDCAERAGMTQSGWSRYLNEPSAEPRRSTLRRVALGLQMPYEEVLKMAGKRVPVASDDEKVKLGERIRTYRTRAGWTQERLADTLGIGRSTLTQYETGAIEPPAMSLKRIADTLSIPISALFQDMDTPTLPRPSSEDRPVLDAVCRIEDRLARIEHILSGIRDDRTSASY